MNRLSKNGAPKEAREEGGVGKGKGGGKRRGGIGENECVRQCDAMETSFKQQTKPTETIFTSGHPSSGKEWVIHLIWEKGSEKKVVTLTELDFLFVHHMESKRAFLGKENTC
jgi:hypothetical protein